MAQTNNISLDQTSTESRFVWLINASCISPGASAIIGNHREAFFIIHYSALIVIITSFSASLLTVGKIISKYSKSKTDFPTRFPLYLAIADLLWGLSHFIDHFYLVTVQTFPSSSLVKQALSINLWFFFGYQQLMHASVAGYAYFGVVHGKKFNLGRWEWKLHSAWFSFLAGTVVLFYFLDSFGSSGYWMAHDATTVNGQILGTVIVITSTFNAFCTTAGYFSIRRTVLNSKAVLRSHIKSGTSQYKEKSTRGTDHHSRASQCLTTFVWVASFLYCPLAVLLWISLIYQIFFGAIEQLTSGLIAIVANSSGWANAYGYFHNEKLKENKNRNGYLLQSPPNSNTSNEP